MKAFNLNNPNWLANREIFADRAFSQRHNKQQFDVHTSLCHNIAACGTWDPHNNYKVKKPWSSGPGGIFGLDFTDDGSVLGVACEKRCLMFFDPVNQKPFTDVQSAHTNCVNAVKFLNGRLFATCSDDHTVSLWDLRYLRSTIRDFKGHTSWVKNIEFLPEEGLLVTSGFDGFIYGWDINRHESLETDNFTRLFYTPGLVRMRLTPAADKMVISTQWGYIIVIHNLNLETLSQDLMGFKPNMYWLMMKSGALFPTSHEHLHKFQADRNRPEIILDFPNGNDPENITSVTPHPLGWCLLSRNTNHDENAEWTCVHDIQLPPVEKVVNVKKLSEEQLFAVRSSALFDEMGDHRVEARDSIAQSGAGLSVNVSSSDAHVSTNQIRAGNENIIAVHVTSDDDLDESLPSTSHVRGRQNNIHVQVSNADFQARFRFSRNAGEPRAFFIRTAGVGGSSSSGSNTNASSRTIILLGASRSEHPEHDAAIPKSYHRLIYAIEEANVGRGFIKEQAFSPDGRLVASPFGYGVRFLAFNQYCNELSDVADGLEHGVGRKLYEVRTNLCHSNVVLCTKFSPTQNVVVSGCMDGKVCFHQPVF